MFTSFKRPYGIMKIYLYGLVFFTCFVSQFCWSAIEGPLDSKVYGPYHQVRVLTVEDGDTVKVRVRLWPVISQDIIVHLKYVDAAEMTVGIKGGMSIPYCERKVGKRAKRFSQRFLRKGEIALTDVSTGPTATSVYGELVVNGHYLSHALVKSGLALALKGQLERIWKC